MDYCPEPFFLDIGERRLFCSSPQSSGVGESKNIIVLPPFAEEMNRVRRYVAHLTGQLLARGFSVTNVDLSSTGDSSGKFSAARVSEWLEDIAAVASRISDPDQPLGVLAIRGGALFLPHILADSSLNIGKVCLIEPISAGGQLLNEFLRVRVAKSVFEGTKETVSSLATVLENGENLEVAGYKLSSSLYHDLLELSLESQSFSLPTRGLVIGCMRAVNDARIKKLEHSVSAWNCPENTFSTTALEIGPFWANDLVNVDSELDVAILDFFSAAGES